MFLLSFEYIDISSEKWAVISMINGGMMICAIVSPIEVTRGPIKTKISLQFATSYPMETQVHGFDFALDVGFVYHSRSCLVVGLDWGWRLFPTHLY